MQGREREERKKGEDGRERDKRIGEGEKGKRKGCEEGGGFGEESGEREGRRDEMIKGRERGIRRKREEG